MIIKLPTPRFLIFTLMLLFFQNSFSQFTVINSTYTSWAGITYDTYLIESNYTVIHIDKNELKEGQINDLETMMKIVNRVDRIYKFYIDNLGFEPPGGNPLYLYKADVFFGPPSCGSGCGKLGSKGIEVSGFQNIFYNLKYDLNVNRDVIIGWEFGRNFFTYGSKIFFPLTPDTDEKNGGFAEAFASVMYLYAFDEIMDNEEQRTLNETLLNIKWNLKMFHGYINDTTATPYNSLAKWDKEAILDPNRGTAGHLAPAYPAWAILLGIFDTFGKENLFPQFFNELRNRPDVVTIEDALSNIVYSTSKSLNKNLVPFFKNVLRFKINEDIENEIKSFPSIDSKLIRDEQLLWFLSPFEKINLNLRSTNYLVDGMTYKLIIDGNEYSNTIDGNNVLDYNILKGVNEKKVTCQLLNNEQLIDTFDVLLKKRHNINIFDYREDLYAYYLSNQKVKSYFEGDELVLEHLDTLNIDYGQVDFHLVFSKNRTIQIEGEIKQDARKYKEGMQVSNLNSSGWSLIKIYGPTYSDGTTRVGYDIGLGDNQSFFETNFNTNTNNFFLEGYNYFLNKLSFNTEGYIKKSYFKNIILKDITDTDGDGIIDFEDNCFETYNPNQSDIDTDGLGDVCDDDIDGDGVLNVYDNCPLFSNLNQSDVDNDGVGDVCDDDDDNDGVMNDKDLCPNTASGTNVNANGCFFLPSNNFSIEVIGETCANKNNGKISISAQANHNYVATINGTNHNFSNNNLSVSNLASGTYDVCIKITGVTFEQCFTITVAEGKTISGKSSVTANKTSIDISQGTAPYNVFVNGINVLNTISPSFMLDVKHGDFVEVKTAVVCEGVFTKTIDLFENIKAYPNPTKGIFEITLPLSEKEVVIELYTTGSQLISKGTYQVDNGKVQLNLENKPTGVYVVKIYLETPVSLTIIKE